MLARAGFRCFVAGIGVAHHAAGRIVPQHALDARRGRIRAVAANNQSGMLRVAHADAATVVERYPGRAA